MLVQTGCAGPLYREEFNLSAPFEAYSHYTALPQHPFDKGPIDQGLVDALQGYLAGSELEPASQAVPLSRHLVFVLNFDVEAGRRRILALAANNVRSWTFQLRKDADAAQLVAIEVYERQSANLIYRAEAARGDSDAETIAQLLSKFPPSTVRTRGLRDALEG
ncbi:MAG: hypothetical protein AAF221_14395 [Pseudomonadota bacterium]